MISKTTRTFWERYRRLSIHIRKQAKVAYHLWQANPYHPGLHFKQIGKQTVSI